MRYETVIGLEVHAELNTKTKAYCACKNQFGAEVNTNCCPICMGMPGALPTLNAQVVESAIRMGHALGCKINGVSKQDRKNYFYPDLPKSYQISQFDIPLCEGGHLDIIVDPSGATRRIGVTRIHIEEDAGKLIHDDRFAGSLVDFNRCGVPLIEIVSEPDLRNSAEAKAYLEGLKAILGYLDISDCRMQEGSIRCDVNVSVRPEGSDRFGTRVEMKNINSFSGAVRAIEFEAARQVAILEAGGEITQQTRRWDDMKGESFLMRTKEDAQDYRYFPEPDLGTIVVSPERIQALKDSLPELPHHRLLRFLADYGLPFADAELLVGSPDKALLFEAGVTGGASAKAAANWILGDVSRLLGERRCELSETLLTPEKLSAMIVLIDNGKISNTAGKAVLETVMFEDKTPEQVVRELGLAQVSDEQALEEIVRTVLDQNQKAAEDFRTGKSNALGFIVGQCMKMSRGKGNPAVLRAIAERLLQ